MNRRILQAVLYEAIGVAVVGPALSLVFGQSVGSSIALAVVVSAVALGWNYVFNSLFEAWEVHQALKGRSLCRRLAHGLGFEGGLAVMLVPLTAWWLEITLLNALFAEIGILAFFFVYAVAFTWAFDRIFGLPQSTVDARTRQPDGSKR